MIYSGKPNEVALIKSTEFNQKSLDERIDAIAEFFDDKNTAKKLMRSYWRTISTKTRYQGYNFYRSNRAMYLEREEQRLPHNLSYLKAQIISLSRL